MIMKTLEKIISPAREEYATEYGNGSFEIDGCKFAFFHYDHNYVKIPGCPESPDVLQWNGFTEKETEEIWIGYKKFAKKFASKSNPFNIKKVLTNCYHYSNGYVAIYCEDGIVVMQTGICEIKASHLLMAGFTDNSELFIPFNEDHIAYYDATTDTFICRW